MMQSIQIIASLFSFGLGWPGLAWAGLGWPGLAWAGLGWPGLAWAKQIIASLFFNGFERV
jgi:hypothetical protein